MSETTTAAAPAATPDATQAASDTSQADKTQPDDGGADEIKRLRAEAAKYRVAAKENAQKAKEYDTFLESQKTEAQKTADRLAQVEKERDEARLEAIRLEVAQSKGLTPGQARRLMGSTREELEADAAAFVAEQKTATRPSGSADQGPRGTAPTADPREAMAAFLKDQLRQ